MFKNLQSARRLWGTAVCAALLGTNLLLPGGSGSITNAVTLSSNEPIGSSSGKNAVLILQAESDETGETQVDEPAEPTTDPSEDPEGNNIGSVPPPADADTPGTPVSEDELPNAEPLPVTPTPEDTQDAPSTDYEASEYSAVTPFSTPSASDPVLIFDEGFEASAGISRLEDYVGVKGQHTRVNPQNAGNSRENSIGLTNWGWLKTSECNGTILSYGYTGFPDGRDWLGLNPQYPGVKVGNTWFCSVSEPNHPAQRRDMQVNARRLADVLGQADSWRNSGFTPSQSFDNPLNRSSSSTQANKAVTEWTAASNVTIFGTNVPAHVVYRSSEINLNTAAADPQKTKHRFYVMSIDAAETSCNYSGGTNPGGNVFSDLVYEFIIGGTTYPVTSGIKPCTAPSGENIGYYTSPLIENGSGTSGTSPWGSGGTSVRAGTFWSESSILLADDAMNSAAVRVLNQTVGANGNDFAFDNLRAFDATPRLFKSFADERVQLEGSTEKTTRLTFTVQNTSELAEKDGWSFTDKLADGLKIASQPDASHTCAAGQLTADAGSDSITITGGKLNSGQASCEISVNVTSDAPGTYENCVDNFSDLTGLKDPECASVEFFEDENLLVAKSANPESGSMVNAGDIVTYTLTFENEGSAPATVDHVDHLGDVLDDADFVAGTLNAESPLSAELTNGGTQVSITGIVPAGETRTVTFDVKIKPNSSQTADRDQGDATDAPKGFLLRNYITEQGEEPPTECEPEDPSCTEHPISGSVTWEKVDADGTPLDGSKWRLTGPAGSSSQIYEIDDCTSAGSCSGPDQDARGGFFSIGNLPWGEYALVETSAPAGYVLDDTEHRFTVGLEDPDHIVIDLGEIENRPQSALIIPLTGGFGSDAFLIAGGGLLSALIVTALIRARRLKFATAAAALQE